MRFGMLTYHICWFRLLFLFIFLERVIQTIHDVIEMRAYSEDLRRKGQTIAFVPTMGYLHDGHLSLMREARRHGDILVLSIFVNPAQFAPHEDFDSYPRDMDRDMGLAEKAGVDVVFIPNHKDLYPQGFQTYVSLENLPNHLCGISRPIFFTGVATVVTKLFNIVMPQVAVFGEKDYQQLTVIRRMVQDLNLNVRIIGGPTVREPDGLAMSSRNAYLKPSQRASALSLYQSLIHARELVEKGVGDASRLIAQASERLMACPETVIEYIAVVDAETLEDVSTVQRPSRMVLAVNVGNTRLIDNMAITPEIMATPSG